MVGRGWWRSDRSVRWCWAVGGVDGGLHSHLPVMVSLVDGGCCCGVDGRRRLWREGVAIWWEGKLLGVKWKKDSFVLLQVYDLERIMASRIFFFFWIFINKSQSSITSASRLSPDISLQHETEKWKTVLSVV
jgi:hypothetical protein